MGLLGIGQPDYSGVSLLRPQPPADVRLLSAAARPQAQASPFEKNSKWAVPSDNYLTDLPPDQEAAFNTWVQQNKVPFDPSPTADYDMRGFWKELQSGGPNAQTGVNANDGQMHFSDYYKTPYHESFSNESKWAKPNAPAWNEKDQLVLPDGTIVFDERAKNR